MRVRILDPRDRKQRQAFIQLPFSIYPPDSLWVPPLESELRLAFDKSKHPFYKHSDADFILVYSEGQPLGRIAVIHNRLYCQHHHTNAGFFYYLECVQDQQVFDRLMDCAEGWMRQRRIDKIIGPKGMLRSSGQGLLVEGFEYPPAVGIAYNPAYYDEMLATAGYQRWTDHLSGYISKQQQLPEALYRIADKVKQRGNFWVRSFRSVAEMRPLIGHLNAIHHQAFASNPNFIPSTPEEFSLMAANILAVAESDMVKLIMHQEEVVGFIITYPDITQALRRIKGRLWPVGWLDVLLEKKRTDVINGNGVGILPQYQGMGANALLYTELEKTLRAKRQYRVMDLVQVDERNYKSMSDMQFVGIEWVKRHRTYQKLLYQG